MTRRADPRRLTGPKTCTKCGQVKDCERDFHNYTDRRGRSAKMAKCKDCHTAIVRRWQIANPGLKNERTREYTRTEQGRVRKRARRYGLSDDQMRALEAQHASCAICGEPFTLEKMAKYHVDHDHATDRVRGLLCGACNLGLGAFRDDPSRLRRAALYLEESSRTKIVPAQRAPKRSGRPMLGATP